MTFQADYFRASIEEKIPTLETPEEQATAENLYALLTPENVDEGIRIELGRTTDNVELFNRLLSIEAGLKDRALHFNQAILGMGADNNYGVAHRGKIIPLLLRSSIIQGLDSIQSTMWGSWRYRTPDSPSSHFLSRLLIAQPVEYTAESGSDITKPWLSVEGMYRYSASQRQAFGAFEAQLVPDDELRHKADLTTGIYRDHPTFTPYALDRLTPAEKGAMPTIPSPQYSLSIGHPGAGHWIANHVITEQTYTFKKGQFVVPKERSEVA
jgi:hypothetical protein